MAEIEQEVKIYKIYYLCDKCGRGDMQPNGVMLASSPPQYPHKCNKCDAVETFNVRYPITEHRNIP